MSANPDTSKGSRPVPLKDLGDWTGGGTPSKSKTEYWENGTVPWVSPKDMKVRHISKAEDYITEAAVRGSATNLVPAGSLLIVTRSGILRHTLPIAISDVPVAINQDLKALSPKPGVSPNYVAYALNAFSQDILRGCSKQGTTVNSIETEKFLRFEIPMVSPAQQEVVVAEIDKQFSRLDEAVSALKRAQANLKRYKAAVLKAAVEGKLTEQWRGDHPDVEPAGRLLQRILADRRAGWRKKNYKEPAAPDTTNLPEFPKGWVWTSLDALLVAIQVGKSFKCEERPPRTGETGVVKVSAVTWGEYEESESKTCTIPGLVNPGLFVRSGDFLFSRANTIELVGACVIANHVSKDVMLSDKILRFRFAKGVDPRWVLHLLRSIHGRAEIERLSTGNQESMRNIGQTRIRSIRITLPPADELAFILAELDRIRSVTDELEASLDANLQRADRLRQTILNRAFNPGPAPV